MTISCHLFLKILQRDKSVDVNDVDDDDDDDIVHSALETL